MAGVAPLMQFCMYTCMLLISWFGARLIVGGSMTTGELTSLFSYAMQILMSLMMVAMVFVMITMSKASAERIVEILEEQPNLHNPGNPVTEVKNGDIDFDNVNFSYKGDEHKLALRNVDLHIKAGQTIGILGGTGAAKSTLVQLIPRLYDVTTGSVKVGGVDVRDYDIEALREQVAMVLQKNVLFSGTIKENLRWGNENASDEELERVCKLAQADEFIQQMPKKYDTYIEQGGTNVSGGQKQRLCIARALLKKPKVLILDDSTSAVDTRTDALIRKAFAEEIPNTTKLIIAQRVSSVQEADQIIILDGGAVQAVGTHEELLASNPIYQEFPTSRPGREMRNNAGTRSKRTDGRSGTPRPDGRRQTQQKPEKDSRAAAALYQGRLCCPVRRGTGMHPVFRSGGRSRFDVPADADRRLYCAAAARGRTGVQRAGARAAADGADLSGGYRLHLPV